MDITDVPTVHGDADDPAWHPLQHFFWITAFGANVFVAREEGQTLIGEHDESGSDQEELYLVLEGEAIFELDGESVVARRGAVVAITDPSVRRRALARSAGAALLVIGVRPGSFESTWRAEHFENTPRA